MSKPLRKATFALPPVQTRKVWVGVYGGHHDVVVVFDKKPKKISAREAARQHGSRFPKGYYSCYDNREHVVGSFGLGDFKEIFGIDPCEATGGRPEGIEIVRVEQMEMTAPFDVSRRIFSFDTFVDGW